jgi:hypothetical protein
VSGEYIIDFMEGHQLSNSEESVLVNSGVYFLTFSDLHNNEKLCVGNIVENLIPSLAKSGLLKYKVCDFPRFAVESLETLRYAREHSDPELN